MNGMECPWCGEVVDSRKHGAMRRVIGWEETRGGGGANKIAFRHEVGVWAHKTCVEVHGGDMTLTHQPLTLLQGDW